MVKSTRLIVILLVLILIIAGCQNPATSADPPTEIPKDWALADIVAKFTAGDAAAGDDIGISVSISGDTAIVGADGDSDGGSNSGSAYIFTLDSGGIWNESAKLTASDAAADDFFGGSVSISGDTAIVGAYGNGSNSGSAYIFIRDSGGNWNESAKLTTSDAAADDWFGYKVSISEDTAIVGAYWNDDSGSNSGSAYIFTSDSGGNWNESAKLTASDAAADDRFGRSVSISKETAIVGTPWDDDGGSLSGSAYVFTRDSGGNWSESAKLTASDAATSDQFGISVSISGDTAIVGAVSDDDAGKYTGSAYIFIRDSGGNWRESAKLTASDAAADDFFGGSVSISGDTAIVGASGDDDGGSVSGAAYIFARCSYCGCWPESETVKLTASDAEAIDCFGGSVSISGDTAFVGARFDDDSGIDSGSVYIVEK